MKMGYVKQFGLDLYMVNEPSLVKKILVDESENFPKHILMHKMLKDLLGESVFTTNGNIWKHQREILNYAFTNAKVSRLFPQMKNAVDAMISRISDFSISHPEDYFEIDSEMTHVTADIIFRAILSKKIDKSDSHEIYSAFLQYQKLSQKMVMMKLFKVPLWRFYERGVKKSSKKIRDFILAIIDERLLKSENSEYSINDMLDIIVNSADSNGKKFSKQELLDQINMLFLAGHETSAASLAWSIYLIANTDDLQNRIYQEIEENSNSGEIEQINLSKLKLTQSVFNESLRLFPPVSFFLREATVDQMVGDKFVRKGSAIVISPWLMHRHRKIWTNPDMFCPDRFLERKDENNKNALNHAYLPFSKGPRTCPGAGFATQEGILILASIVKKFKIQPDPHHIPVPSAKVTLRAKNCIKVKLIPRF